MSARPEVVVATGNPGKLREIRAILADLPIAWRPLGADGLARLPPEGASYEANARAKALAAARARQRPAVADDSGLEVEGLAGGPGPRSARFGGPGLDDAGRVRHLLDLLGSRRGAARRARFVCVAALALPDGRVASARGECAGRILTAPRGADGFGYDPVFALPGDGRTLAELPAAEKDLVSHRGRAFRALRPRLFEWVVVPQTGRRGGLRRDR